jgi:hypothetical protein
LTFFNDLYVLHATVPSAVASELASCHLSNTAWSEREGQMRLFADLLSFGVPLHRRRTCGSELVFIVICMEGLLGTVTNRPHASTRALRYTGLTRI